MNQTKSLFILRSWEEVDEAGQSKNDVVLDAGITGFKNTKKRPSLEFIYTAVKNLAQNTTSRPSSPKATEVKSNEKIPAVRDGNKTNESKPEKVPAKSYKRYRNMILFLTHYSAKRDTV